MTLWFALSLGLALLVAGWLVLRGARVAGLLTGSIVLGGAAVLWLTDPLWFPALRLGLEHRADPIMLALIALQGLLALAVLWRGPGPGPVWAALRGLGLGRVGLFFALLGLFAVSVQGYWGWFASYGMHLVIEGAAAAIAVLSLVALVIMTPDHVRIPRLPPIALAGLAGLASVILGLYGFERLPHVEDELAYLLQARGFAAGAASFPAPPEAAQGALDFYLLDIEAGRWFATTPPGWPLVLALGELVGQPHLVNPVLTALSVWLFHAVLVRHMDRDMAHVATLFLATSPWLIAMGASLMTHSLSLALILLAWWLLSLPAARRGPAMTLAFGAGLALGWLFTTRQLEGVIIGVTTGLWLLRGGIVPALPRAIPYGLGCIATGSVYLIHNAALTGSALVSPLARYTSKLWGEGSNGFGFGPRIGPPEGAWGNLDLFTGHSPLEGLVYTVNNIASLDFEMFGWPIGALALIWVLLIWGRFSRFEIAMGLLAAVVVIIHAFYWFAGAFYIGPRYWFVALPAFVVLSAGGWRTLHDRMVPARFHAGLGLGTGLLCAFSLLVFTSFLGVARYFEFRDNYGDLARAVADRDLGTALVFVKTEGDLGPVFMHNDMALPADRPIFLPDRGAQANAAVAAAFPDRPVIQIETR